MIRLHNLFIAHSIVILLSFVDALASQAPWQTLSTNTVEDSIYADQLPPTTYSSTGRIFALEKTIKSTYERGGSSAALIRYKKGIAVVASQKYSPYLPANATIAKHIFHEQRGQLPVEYSPFVRLSPQVWALTAGNTIASRILTRKLQNVAQYSKEAGEPITPRFIARRIADDFQSATQSLQRGPTLASHALIFSEDEAWTVDPSGNMYLVNGVAIGSRAPLIERDLLEAFNSSEIDSFDDEKKVLSLIRQALLLKTANGGNDMETYSMTGLILRDGGNSILYNNETLTSLS